MSDILERLRKLEAALSSEFETDAADVHEAIALIDRLRILVAREETSERALQEAFMAGFDSGISHYHEGLPGPTPPAPRTSGETG